MVDKGQHLVHLVTASADDADHGRFILVTVDIIGLVGTAWWMLTWQGDRRSNTIPP